MPVGFSTEIPSDFKSLKTKRSCPVKVVQALIKHNKETNKLFSFSEQSFVKVKQNPPKGGRMFRNRFHTRTARRFRAQPYNAVIRPVQDRNRRIIY